MKKNLKVLITTILIIFVLSISSIATTIVTELEDKHNQLTNQIQQSEEQLEEVQSNLSGVLQTIQELTDKIDSYEREIRELNLNSEVLRIQINEREEKLKVAEESFNEQQKLLEGRLVTLYESSDTTYLDVLLSSKSISEFLSNYYLISEIAKYDVELLDDIEKEKNYIEESKKQLEEQKERLKITKNNKERMSIVLENTKVLMNKEKEKLSEEEKKIQEEIDLYNQQVKEVEEEILILTTANLDSDYTGGVMAWPVPGYSRISSQFGMRVHPITAIYKLHTGVDIAAPTGANFIAASDGVVIKAGYNSAYGNMVIIDHGGGVSTLYAHGSQIVATLGQTVRRGDIVLKVGSTGYSTGPHAHFEVRINGNYVNPINYITKST